MNHLWNVQLLGGLRAEQGGQIITRFRTQKAGALFAFLALFPNRTHTREELVERFWPDADPEAGRASLRSALASLRRQLETADASDGAVLVTRGHTDVLLQPDTIATDVAAFEKLLKSASKSANAPDERARLLMEAVAVYKGPLLPGFYDSWALAERDRLSECCLDALAQLVAYHEQIGQINEALAFARRAVSADPLREEAHSDVIRLLMASGEQAAARQQFDQMQSVLDKELGTEPSDEARALVSNTGRPSSPIPPTASQPPELQNASSLVASSRSSGAGTDPPPPFPSSSTAIVRNEPPDVSIVAGPVSLPLTLNRFFGREAEITALSERLNHGDARLVTLTGAGGSGKTRLAVETARRLTERFSGGIWFVVLADVCEPERLIEAVADAMGLPRSPTISPVEQISDTLRRAGQPALLILDNFEQLVDAGGAEPLQSLLLRAPSLTCLVTTRQRLQIEGEQEMAIAPLPIPTGPVAPNRLMQYPGVQLFVNRAQSTRPDFQLTPRNAATVAALCVRLEGIPLALELAAAWTQMLTLAQILERLERRFDLLVARRRDVAGRHATLRATIEWSYQLLPPDLQQFFTRLSVFRGGWTLEAAESVMDEPRALAFLAELRERSLIIAEESAEPDRVGQDEDEPTAGPTMRFRMLESLREFASEQIGSPARREELAERHRIYFLALAELAAPFLRGSAQISWLTRLEREHDNFRDALAWSLHRDETATDGLRLAVALTWFWLARSYNREGRDWLDRALTRAVAAPTKFRAAALRGAGWLAWRVHDTEQAVALCEAGLVLSRELDDSKGIAFCLSILGETAHHNGEGERGRALLEESVAIARESGDLWILGHCLTSLGHILLPQGEPETACDRFEESLAAFRAQGDHYGIAEALKALSLIYCVLGRPDDAEQAVYESIALFHALGETDRVGMAHLILGYMAHDTQDYATARAHFDTTLRLCSEAGNRFGMAHALHNRAHAFFHDGEPASAREDFEQSLPLFRDLGYQGDVALSLEGFALVALEERQWGRAARIYGAATTIRENAGVHLPEAGRERLEEQMARIREAIGDKRTQSAWDTGRALTVEQAVAFVLGE